MNAFRNSLENGRRISCVGGWDRQRVRCAVVGDQPAGCLLWQGEVGDDLFYHFDWFAVQERRSVDPPPYRVQGPVSAGDARSRH